MSKTRLYPDDIREAVLADIRAFDACRNVRNVALVPVKAPEAETNWAIRTGCNVSMRQYGRMTNVLIGRQPLCSSGANSLAAPMRRTLGQLRKWRSTC